MPRSQKKKRPPSKGDVPRVEVEKKIVHDAHTVVIVHGRFLAGARLLGDFGVVMVW